MKVVSDHHVDVLSKSAHFFAEAGSVFRVRQGETVVCYKLDMLAVEPTYVYSLAQSNTVMMYLEPGNLTHADLNAMRYGKEGFDSQMTTSDGSSIHLFLCEDNEVGVFLPTMVFALERIHI